MLFKVPIVCGSHIILYLVMLLIITTPGRVFINIRFIIHPELETPL